MVVLTRYAGLHVAASERDAVVEEALVHAWRRSRSDDLRRGTPLAWLLTILADRCGRHRARGLSAGVELLDQAEPGLLSDVDLELALGRLADPERTAVDLHYFVGLDVETTAAVMGSSPPAAEDTLQRARTRLDDLMESRTAASLGQRLSHVGRRWQELQPPPPDVPLERLAESPHRRSLWLVVAAAAAAVVVGALAAGRLSASDPTPATPGAAAAPVGGSQVAPVAWADEPPRHPRVRTTLAPQGNQTRGRVVTPFDGVSATGSITGSAHPGAIIAFQAVLESSTDVVLVPCPDYRIAVGYHWSTSLRLNCSDVPFRDVRGRPYLPAHTDVSFQMVVGVPRESGRLKVRWTLEGPQRAPGFQGLIDVLPHG